MKHVAELLVADAVVGANLTPAGGDASEKLACGLPLQVEGRPLGPFSLSVALGTFLSPCDLLDDRLADRAEVLQARVNLGHPRRVERLQLFCGRLRLAAEVLVEHWVLEHLGRGVAEA